jgi:HD-GYP domain-containing protein (c-di-GMP phosphodiesterase class II)
MKMSLTEKLIKVGIALSSTRDLNKLLDLILTEARDLTNADAGSVYLLEGDTLRFVSSQNQTLFDRLGEEKARALFEEFTIPLNKESIAGYVAVTRQLLNLHDVYKIPSDYGFRFNSSWDEVNHYKSVSMLVMPMISSDDKVVGVLQLINAMSEDGKIVPFAKEYKQVINAFASQAAVAIVNVKLHQQLQEAHLDTVFRLGVAAEYRDKETANHIKRVSEYSALIGRKIGLSEKEIYLLYWASAMHDVGKLGIPDAILHKPGPLTQAERHLMEYHTLLGAYILRKAKSPLLLAAQEVALTHHEKFDGSGYPRGLKGEDIPLFGRIVAIVDVFDALSSRRVYKPPFPEEKVIKIMNEERGRHFDPYLADALLSDMVAVRAIQQRFADKEEDFDKYRNIEKLTLKDLAQEIYF